MRRLVKNETREYIIKNEKQFPGTAYRAGPIAEDIDANPEILTRILKELVVEGLLKQEEKGKPYFYIGGKDV